MAGAEILRHRRAWRGILCAVRSGYADGQKTGTDLQATIIDACWLISARWHTATRLAVLADEATEGGAVAAILAALVAGEADGWAVE